MGDKLRSTLEKAFLAAWWLEGAASPEMSKKGGKSSRTKDSREVAAAARRLL